MYGALNQDINSKGKAWGLCIGQSTNKQARYVALSSKTESNITYVVGQFGLMQDQLANK